MLKRFVLRVLFALLPAVTLAAGAQAQPVRVVNIGVVVDGPWEQNTEILSLFKSEILALTEGEFDVRFPEARTIVSDWDPDHIRTAVDELLAARDVDLVLTLGIVASLAACERGELPKPTIAPVVIDPALRRLPAGHGTSGIHNLNYLVLKDYVDRELAAFRQIVPFERVAVLVNRSVVAALPGAMEHIAEKVRAIGLEPTMIPVGGSADDALKALPDDAEAVYAMALLELRPGELDRLAAALIERGLPSFAHLGPSRVERGFMASLNSDFFPRLTRRVAINVQRILLGEDPSTFPTEFTVGEQLTINMATARAIGHYPPWAAITDAVLINDVREDIERTISLAQAAREALDANLDLAVRERALAASEKDVKRAGAALLPQVDLSLTGVQIDKDRAETSLGQQAERTLTGSVEVSQIVFSEPVWANRSIQRHLYNSSRYERDALTLDILKAATTAYLSLLRARTFERIQRDNLERTRDHLDMARVRETLGTARAAEVLRWESELANNRKAVIEANAQRNIAEIALNRLLHRPAEEQFLTEEVGLSDAALLLPQSRLTEYMNNPWDFKVFRRFMVAEGLRSTPEIEALSEAIAARERSVDSATRAHLLPSVGVFAGLDNVFKRDGAGADIPPALSGIVQPPEDLSWQVGVSLNFPLFRGGAKFHERSRAIAAAGELRLELASVREKVEQRIRTALHGAGASYAGMGQARIAADAAAQSLDLVEDAYSQGAATILDVLDAQNNARVADEVAADAVYGFLIDLMEVERSIGHMVVNMSDEEREGFYGRLRDFFAQNRQ
jgi:outer membrane protein TolC/ABC-type uncharacterized transport system substrate-binding protein